VCFNLSLANYEKPSAIRVTGCTKQVRTIGVGLCRDRQAPLLSILFNSCSPSDSPPAAVLRSNKGKQRAIVPPKSDTDKHLSVEEDVQLPMIKKVKTGMRTEVDPCVVTSSHHLMGS
jgi:hypothetical protein